MSVSEHPALPLCVAGSVALCGRLCGSVWQVLWLCVASPVALCGRLCGSV